MTALTRDDLATLDAVNSDWRPSRVEARKAIRRAILTAAEHNDGYVHIADVRPLLPTWIAQGSIGAYISRLARDGVLAPTSEWRPNGGPSRNASKPARVRRLVRPIPEAS